MTRRASAPVVVEGPHRRPSTAAQLLAIAAGLVFGCLAIVHVFAVIWEAAP